MSNEILTAISTVGFPIVACCYMAYSINKQSADHHDEVAKLTEALNDLKIVITELRDRIKE